MRLCVNVKTCICRRTDRVMCHFGQLDFLFLKTGTLKLLTRQQLKSRNASAVRNQRRREQLELAAIVKSGRKQMEILFCEKWKISLFLHNRVFVGALHFLLKLGEFKVWNKYFHLLARESFLSSHSAVCTHSKKQNVGVDYCQWLKTSQWIHRFVATTSQDL